MAQPNDSDRLPHDPAFKAIFSHPRMIADALRGYAVKPNGPLHPRTVAALDFGTLEKLPAEWITRDFRRRVLLGMEQGVQRGLEPGVAQAHARGVARLRRQAAIKFGAPTAERLHDLLVTALPADRLERLEDRTSEWLMACEHGEDLLARVTAFVRGER